MVKLEDKTNILVTESCQVPGAHAAKALLLNANAAAVRLVKRAQYMQQSAFTSCLKTLQY